MRSALEAFEEISIKLKRANKHIRDLEREIHVFMNPSPYSVIPQDDLETGNRTYFIHFIKPMPPDLSVLIGDAIQNLRSTLDHLASRLVEIGPGTAKVKNAYYPIYETSQDYEADKMRKIKGASPEAIKALDSTEPYTGGYGWHLWAINEMNNRDKHRLLIPAWGNLISHTPTKPEKERIQNALGALIWHGWTQAAKGITFLKNGDPILTIPISESHDHMAFRVAIAFGEPLCVRGKQVIPTLESMSRLVAEIVVKFYENGLL